MGNGHATRQVPAQIERRTCRIRYAQAGYFDDVVRAGAFPANDDARWWMAERA